MSIPLDRRTRKRLATRQGISDVATRLFLERGFDAVTMDEIATAADVGRMTVFNHFPRKEDLFFDRDAEGRAELRQAVRRREPGISPMEALCRLARRLAAEPSPVFRFSDGSRRFVETAEGSETLKARARAIRDELTGEVADLLRSAVGRPSGDPDAHLAAGLLLAGWTVAFIEAHRVYRDSGDAAAAGAVLLALLDRSAVGLATTMAGTPYG